MKLLTLLLLVKINIGDDKPANTQVPYSCGQLRLQEVQRCWWIFCNFSYKLYFYNITTTDDTISTDDDIKCIICQLDPHGKGGYTILMVRSEFKFFA
jgi:hypothetical protein